MEEFLKKVAFLGLGTVSATREKIEQGIERLVKKGEISAAQGKKVAAKLLSDADRTRKEIAKKIDEGVREGMAKAGVVTTKDIQALKRRIERLERKLAAHEAKPSHAAKKKPVSKKKTASSKKR
jgi:polyhydroxyalkanoate synthesis regulator phasin